ncbi:MAG: RES family NAD+ phosphorylase [Alphaproteobacteria bacterium]
MIPAVTQVRWDRTYRLIRSIYPPVNLFEDVADPADWGLIANAEAKTNPRVRDDLGAIQLVPVERRVSGAGASWVMAPFCHVSRARPSRFSDGSYGVYYAGNRFEVALHETIYHFERFMHATAEEPVQADYRELVGMIDRAMHDIRNDEGFADALDPADYAPGQSLARRLRDGEDSNGVVYPSVRFPAGEAIAAFWPDVVTNPIQARHLRYRWNGSCVDAYLIYGADNWISFG